MYHAVEGLGAAVFQYAYETLASPKHALERMLLQEVAAQPDQSRQGGPSCWCHWAVADIRDGLG